MTNLLAYAGCIHHFQLNDFGHVKIEIFTYDIETEKFVKIANSPLKVSTTMQCQKCTVVGSCLADKALLVLVQLIAMNSSALMFIRLQSRPWTCQIIYTLSIPAAISGTLRFMSINSVLSIFIKEEDEGFSRGFYTVDNTQTLQRSIEFIACPLSKYLYCQTKENYYWLMGVEIDPDTERKTIKVYYGCSSSPSHDLVTFNTHKFFPVSLIDNLQHVHVLNHKFQLKTRSIIGDTIVSSQDHRVFTCHNGTISHELQFDALITSILSYNTIDNGLLLLLIQNDVRLVEVVQYDQNFTLVPFTDTAECADCLLMDDFAQTGWKQIVFFKFDDNITLDSFILTDFSQIHAFQQGFEFEHHSAARAVSVDMNDDDDDDIQASLALAQDLLRKKIINADFIVSEGHFQCRKIESDIRQASNKHYVPDLITHTPSDRLMQTSKLSLQLIDTTWFIYRTTLFVNCTVKNIGNIPLSQVYLFGIDKQYNKTKIFDLKKGFEALPSKRTSFRMEVGGRLTFVLTTSLDLNRDIDLQLFVLIDNDNNHHQLFQISTVTISLDDLINLNSHQQLQMDALETKSFNHILYRRALSYVSTLFQLGVTINCKSKFQTVEHLRQILSTIDFKSLMTIPNIYLRINEGTILEHVLVHLVNVDDDMIDDLIVHFYAKCSNETVALAKYFLSKLDFHSLSLIEQSSSHDEPSDTLINRLRIELTSCTESLQSAPVVMRKITPAAKSESYRLLKSDNFHLFQLQCHLTDLLLTSLFIT